MLTERKHTILQSLIQEYVKSAHPVASSTLARYYVPRLSPATVRNELSWLEDRGYVAQPHTSAGRMPTTIGYRTFVNSILLHPKQFAAFDYQQAVRIEAALVTELPDPYSSLSASMALAAALDKLSLIHEVLGLLANNTKCLMVFWAPQLASSIIHRGLPLLLSQPEFAETSAALPIMQLLESHGELMTIFEDVVETGGLHIKIGSEHKDTQLYEFSLVAMRFDCANLTKPAAGKQAGNPARASHLKQSSLTKNSGGKNYGVVALFGPTRMDYEWAIASISALVRDLECPGRQ